MYDFHYLDATYSAWNSENLLKKVSFTDTVKNEHNKINRELFFEGGIYCSIKQIKIIWGKRKFVTPNTF